MTRGTSLFLLFRLAITAPVLAQPRQPTLTVYGAADLALALKDIAPLFEKVTGSKVTVVLGSTGNLAKQIEHGAPADVFFAANAGFIEDLRAKGAIIPETQTPYAQGRIVLASSRRAGLKLNTLDDLLRADVRKVAIAHPDHAPSGR